MVGPRVLDVDKLAEQIEQRMLDETPDFICGKCEDTGVVLDDSMRRCRCKAGREQ